MHVHYQPCMRTAKGGVPMLHAVSLATLAFQPILFMRYTLLMLSLSLRMVTVSVSTKPFCRCSILTGWGSATTRTSHGEGSEPRGVRSRFELFRQGFDSVSSSLADVCVATPGTNAAGQGLRKQRQASQH
eukprot:9655327-Heterocapsa_arctica.AAC.1